MRRQDPSCATSLSIMRAPMSNCASASDSGEHSTTLCPIVGRAGTKEVDAAPAILDVAALNNAGKRFCPRCGRAKELALNN